MIRHQGSIFAERYCRLLSRDRTAIAFSLLQGVAVALLTALVAAKPMVWNLKGAAPLFVFGCSAVWFGMLNSVRELVKERTIWRREQLVGGNTAAYLTSKLGVLGALGAFQTVTSVAVLALTIGLPGSGGLIPSFVTIGITLFLANLCGMAIGLLVSSLASSTDRAMSIVPYLLISQLVLCGVLFPLRNLGFVSWFIPARWAVSALGGIAGLSGNTAQTGGFYPHSMAGHPRGVGHVGGAGGRRGGDHGPSPRPSGGRLERGLSSGQPGTRGTRPAAARSPRRARPRRR